MLQDLISYVFPVLMVACGVTIVVRFRRSPGAVFGGIAFGLWAMTAVARRVLNTLEVEWWEYAHWFTLSNLASYGCLLAALITGRTHPAPRAAAGAGLRAVEREAEGKGAGEGEAKPLAGRGARLGAVLLDAIVSLLAITPGVVALFTLEGDPDIPVAGVVLVLVGAVVVMIIQVVLLMSAGQTIGKKALGVRIVRHDDQRNPGFVRVVVLRGFVPGLIGTVPFLGGIFALMDILFIFGEERRCIHDLLAGTRVVVA